MPYVPLLMRRCIELIYKLGNRRLSQNPMTENQILASRHGKWRDNPATVAFLIGLSGAANVGQAPDLSLGSQASLGSAPTGRVCAGVRAN
jgi:hypothetical protein